MAVEIDICGPAEPPLGAIRAGSAALGQFGRPGLWWPDHLMGWFPQAAWAPEFGVAAGLAGPNDLADPFIAAAVGALAARPRRVGIVVTDPLRRHPASLLQSAATVAADGTEFVLGIGGGAAANIAPYGLDMDARFRSLADAVRMIRDLQATDAAISGEYRSFRLAGGVAGIPQRRDVRIWIGGSGPGAVRLAGRLGDGWVPTRLPPEQYAGLLGEVRAAAERVGRPRPVASMYAWSLVCESRAAAEALLRRALFLRSLLFFRGPDWFAARGLAHPLAGVAPSTDYLPATLTREQAARALDRVPEELVAEYVVAGSPADIRAWLARMEQAGLQHVVLFDLAHYVAGGAEASRLGDLLAESAAPAGR